MHLFAGVSGATAVVDGQLSWSIVVRQELGFADVEADRRRLVRFLWFRNLVLDGDVKHPTRPVFLELKLSNCHVAVEQVIPQLPLSGVDAERDPRRRYHVRTAERASRTRVRAPQSGRCSTLGS